MEIHNRPSMADLEQVFAKQQKHQWQLKKTTAQERTEKLLRLKACIQKYQNETIAALYKDLRKPARDAKNDLYICYSEIDDAVANLADWMEPKPVPVSKVFAEGEAQIISESLGVILLFGPWNFPYHLVLQPLIPMIAAGNCVLVKPNEMAPATSKLLAKIIKECFDEEEVAVFEGGVDLANDLLTLPVNHIFFTGSPAVGKLVMKAAAQHLASVTLELGGKNPVVIDRTADIVKAASKIAVYRAMNCGQLCLCPENVYLPAESLDTFIATVKAVYEKVFYQDGQLNPDATGKIIDHRNFQRVTGYIEDAVAKGATLACGGRGDAETLTIEPAILTDIPADARILQEEIFGPILCVFTYESIEEVLATLQCQPKPLALYPFSQDQAFINRLLQETSSGGVTVNDCVMHCVEHNLPFGGVNNSGIGRYHGFYGFKELSHERAVLYPKKI